MKSHRFNINEFGISIIWPWLFRQFLFLEISTVIIYPFVIYPSINASKLTCKDLDGNMTMIFLAQQEEVLMALFAASISLFFIIGGISFWLMLIAPGIFISHFIKTWIKKRAFLKKLPFPYAITFVLSESPFYTEAYANCNYPSYLKERRIFAWIKYIGH